MPKVWSRNVQIFYNIDCSVYIHINVISLTAPFVDIWPIKINGSEYRLTNGRQSWMDSRKECLRYGGDLAHRGIRDLEQLK